MQWDHQITLDGPFSFLGRFLCCAQNGPKRFWQFSGRSKVCDFDPLALPIFKQVAGRHLNSAHSLSMARSEEHTSELQTLMRISYAVFCLKKKKKTNTKTTLYLITVKNKLTNYDTKTT